MERDPEPPGPVRPAMSGAGQRAADVLAMHRLSRRTDAVQALLRWLARRTGCWVGLLDASGNVLGGAPERYDPGAAPLVDEGLPVMLGRGLRTFTLGAGTAGEGALLVVDVPGAAPDLVLAVVGPAPLATYAPADASTMLGGCWWAGETERTRRRVEVADARGREAVLHLLMSGHLTTAHQIASTLAPALSDPARVLVVECASARRGEVVRACAELTGGRAWIVRCPVYAEHVIVVDSADTEADSGTGDGDGSRSGSRRDGRPPLEVALTAAVGGCVVGAGDVVPLRDTAVGYEQAFHALAVARGRAGRWARFDTALELSAIMGPPGHVWAEALLGSLAGYVPPRGTGPGGQQLMATARSWLSFSTAATRHLKIHRNTLSARLRRIEELLGLDLDRAGDQAQLDLALRIAAAPGRAETGAAGVRGAGTGFADLMLLPGVHRWALTQFGPVRESVPELEPTLRAWLRAGGRLSATAEDLDISVTGTRKRLVRLEQVLQRSLLRTPDVRHDLWVAARALDGPDT